MLALILRLNEAIKSDLRGVQVEKTDFIPQNGRRHFAIVDIS